MDEPKYKRVLLKISGEALAGDKHFGLDFQVMGRVADVIKECVAMGVQVGVVIGGGAPVPVQSMTNTDTRDAAATLSQVRALAQAGCDIVRLSVYDEQCLEALPAIIEGSPVPLVADIHYRADLAFQQEVLDLLLAQPYEEVQEA